ncbi:MAG: thioredoxin family protein [Bacteroidia bacterium]|nr:thioredoxin family protein [Bacteroidia bacterium]MCX7652760.1 thioredoxin family protein [Bacteroidia bacterium]MDW8417407.1 thioredoxin family protein [Bacteroidia bacterium]
MRLWQIVGLLAPLYAQILWQEINTAFQRAQVLDRLLLIYIYTPWCSLCKMMEQNTWEHPTIAVFATKNFHCVRLNAEARDSIFFKGTYFPYLTELHANQLAYLLLNGKMEYPALVIMEPSGNVLLTINGYISLRLMDEILRYFGAGFYRRMSWEEFQKTYPSQL